MQKRSGLTRILIASVLGAGTLGVVAPAEAQVGGKCRVTAQQTYICDQYVHRPSDGAIKPAIGSPGGPARKVQPRVVWDVDYFDARCPIVEMDGALTPEQIAEAYLKIKSARYTPRWTAGGSGPLPAAYTLACRTVPTPQTPLPPVEEVLVEAPFDPVSFSAQVAAGLPVPQGSIDSNYNRALLTGAPANFWITGLSGGEVEQNINRNGFRGEVSARLTRVQWNFGPGQPSASGFTATHTYQSIGSGTATVTVTTVWAMDGYVRGPILGTLFDLQPVTITRTSPPFTLPINQVIAARSETIR